MDKKTVREALNDLDKINDADCLWEMATVGYFSDKKKNSGTSLIRVMVTSDGGRPQAHVHITRKKGNPIFSCIKLDRAEYFLHDKSRDKLTKEQLQSLINFFNSPSEQRVYSFQGKEYKLRTRWDFTIIMWNLENEPHKKVWLPISMDKDGYIISPPMPDYSKLETVG